MVDQVDQAVAAAATTNGVVSIEVDESIPHKPDDDEIALMIIPLLKANNAFFRGKRHEYISGRYEARDQRETVQLVREFMRPLRSNGVAVNARRVTSVAQMVENDLYVADRDILEAERQQANYLNFRNGLLNFTKGQLEKHRRDLYFTSQLGYDFDPEAGCSSFLHFLKTSLTKDSSGIEPDWETIGLVQEAAGYSLTARTDQQSAFWPVGATGSGKSTLIKALMMVAGDLAGALDLNQLGTNKYQLASLVGKRIVTCTESDTTILPDGVFKALTGGGDAMQAEVKYQSPFTFVPSAKLWWAMNDAPRTKDRSGALVRRLRPIVFNRTIPDNERDGQLDDKLYEERPGICAWALVGLKRLQRRGSFLMPEQSRRWLADYALRNDHPRMFRDENMEPAPEEWIPAMELYDRYTGWCLSRGIGRIGFPGMSAEWQRLGFHYRQVASGSQYGGWRFKR